MGYLSISYIKGYIYVYVSENLRDLSDMDNIKLTLKDDCIDVKELTKELVIYKKNEKKNENNNGINSNKLNIIFNGDIKDMLRIIYKNLYDYNDYNNNTIINTCSFEYNDYDYDCFKNDIKNKANIDVLEKLKEVLAYIEDGQFYIFKTVSKSKKEEFKILTRTCANKEKFEDKTIKAIVKNNHKYISYKSLVNDPIYNEDYVFNIYNKFRAHNNEKYDLSKINLILSHIKEIWANNNVNDYNYILNWFSSILKNPEKKTEIVLTLVGLKERTGKNVITEFLVKHLFGMLYSTTQLDLKVDINSVNEWATKYLIILNEVPNISKILIDKFKPYITDKETNISIGSKVKYSIENRTNFIMCSNNDISIIKNSPRYKIFYVNCSKVGDMNYFDKLSLQLNDESAKHLYSYLVNR